MPEWQSHSARADSRSIPGIKILRAGSGESVQRRLTWIVRNLEIRVGTAQDQADPTRIIDKIGKVRESFILLSPIVDGIIAAGWIFDSKIVLFVAAGHVITEATLRATSLETGEYGVVRTAIVRNIATIQIGAYLGYVVIPLVRKPN